MTRLPPQPPSIEITPKPLYLNRREFIKNSALTLGTAAAVGTGLMWLSGNAPPPDSGPTPPLAAVPQLAAVTTGSPFDTTEEQTPLRDVTTYNNFYEYGLDKPDPARNAYRLQPRPWTINVEGEVTRPQTIDIDTLLSWFPLEQRI